MKDGRAQWTYILPGRSNGRQTEVLPDSVSGLIPVNAGDQVIVEGINVVKRHTRPNPQLGTPGGIVQREAPLHISNVALRDPKTGKPTRVGFKVNDKGRKVRVAKGSGVEIDV